MSQVVITGGAGFIGSHRVDAFLARGNDATAVDSLRTGSRDRIARHAVIRPVPPVR